MEFRPATRDDVLAIVGSVPTTVRAYAAVEDGVVYGVGGVYYHGGHVFAFSQALSNMSKKDRVRGAHKIMDIVRKVQGPVWAIRGAFDTADKVLQHFGFEQVNDSEYYIWRKTA